MADLPNRGTKSDQEIRDEEYAQEKGWPEERLQDLRGVDERLGAWREALNEAFENPSEQHSRALENTAEKYQGDRNEYEEKWGEYEPPFERALEGALESLENSKSPPNNLDDLMRQSYEGAGEPSGESEPEGGERQDDEPDEAGQDGGDQGEGGSAEERPSGRSPHDNSEPGSGQERGDEPDEAGGDGGGNGGEEGSEQGNSPETTGEDANRSEAQEEPGGGDEPDQAGDEDGGDQHNGSADGPDDAGDDDAANDDSS